MKTANSIIKIPIRLPEERWIHITEEHSEMAGYYYDVFETIEQPEEIYKGKAGELPATREISNEDGFIITSFLSKRINQVRRREKIWPK